MSCFSLSKCLGNSLVVQWLGFGAFTAETWVQSLVRKLRSHRPHSTTKINFFFFKCSVQTSPSCEEYKGTNGLQAERVCVCVCVCVQFSRQLTVGAISYARGTFNLCGLVGWGTG